MKHNPARNDRHSIRLRGYDYSTVGAYFVTICLNQRIPKKMHLFPRAGAALRGCPCETKCCPETKSAKMQTNTHIANLNAGQARRPAPTWAERDFDFPTFGFVENGVMVLNDSGKMVQQIWNEIPKYYSGVELAEFIVMPDHIHGIIKINVGAALRGCPCPTIAEHPNDANNNPVSLPYLIYCIKTRTTNKYINGVKAFKWKPFNKKLWQRNYYEHIIRDEAEYARIAEYIHNNPILWEKKY